MDKQENNGKIYLFYKILRLFNGFSENGVFLVIAIDKLMIHPKCTRSDFQTVNKYEED